MPPPQNPFLISYETPDPAKVRGLDEGMRATVGVREVVPGLAGAVYANRMQTISSPLNQSLKEWMQRRLRQLAFKTGRTRSA